METVFSPFIKNIERIKNDLPKIIEQIIIDNKEDIINVVRHSQLGVGLNSKGKPLSFTQNGRSGNGYYAPATQKKANESKDYSFDKPKTNGSPYNFFWSGDTLTFMGLKIVNDNKFEIFSSGGKQKLLESIYGEIFDLTEQHNYYINTKVIFPKLTPYILNNLVKL